MYSRPIHFHVDQGGMQAEVLCGARSPYSGDVAFGGPISLSRAPGPQRWVESGKSASWSAARGGGDLLLVLTDRAHLRSAVAQQSPSVGEPGLLPAT